MVRGAACARGGQAGGAEPRPPLADVAPGRRATAPPRHRSLPDTARRPPRLGTPLASARPAPPRRPRLCREPQPSTKRAERSVTPPRVPGLGSACSPPEHRVKTCLAPRPGAPSPAPPASSQYHPRRKNERTRRWYRCNWAETPSANVLDPRCDAGECMDERREAPQLAEKCPDERQVRRPKVGRASRRASGASPESWAKLPTSVRCVARNLGEAPDERPVRRPESGRASRRASGVSPGIWARLPTSVRCVARNLGEAPDERREPLPTTGGLRCRSVPLSADIPAACRTNDRIHAGATPTERCMRPGGAERAPGDVSGGARWSVGSRERRREGERLRRPWLAERSARCVGGWKRGQRRGRRGGDVRGGCQRSAQRR
jgi:hypothetical protein